jgi:hypothetical protein
VEPRRFGPLTSAVQKRLEAFVAVRGCSENSSFKPDFRGSRSRLFAFIRLDNCQVNGVSCQCFEYCGFWFFNCFENIHGEVAV